MKCYVIGEIDVTDQSWVPDYVEKVTRLIEERGGRYLARTSNVSKMEGRRDAPRLVVLLEFPSRDAAEEFYNCAEYRPFRDSRIRGAQSELMLVPGEDIARGARALG
jgi:uncharacterized protein (DUF1330 family)